MHPRENPCLCRNDAHRVVFIKLTPHVDQLHGDEEGNMSLFEPLIFRQILQDATQKEVHIY